MASGRTSTYGKESQTTHGLVRIASQFQITLRWSELAPRGVAIRPGRDEIMAEDLPSPEDAALLATAFDARRNWDSSK